MGKIIDKLIKRYGTTDLEYIDKNIVVPERTTIETFSQVGNSLSLASFLEFYIGNVNQRLLNDVSFSQDMSYQDFIEAISSKVNPNVAENMRNFAKDSNILNEDKTVVANVFANIIYNLSKHEEEFNDDLWDVLFSVINYDKSAKTRDIDDLYGEVIQIFANHDALPNVEEYFVSSFVQIGANEGWLDYKNPLEPSAYEDGDLPQTIVIESKEDLIEALKDSKNYPAIIEYIKENYLSDSNPKNKSAYCANEFVKDYKAIAVLLKLIKDTGLNQEDGFDSDNNIGYNLTVMYELTQDKLNAMKYPAKLQASFLNQAAKVANTILEKPAANVYSVWKRVVTSYIKKCKALLTKIKNRELSPTDRKYLVAMGMIKEREIIKDYDKLFAALREKVRDMNELKDYLTNAKIKELPSDPSIDDSKQLFEELIEWCAGIKNLNAVPSKIAQIDKENLGANLKVLYMVASRKTEKAPTKSAKTSAGTQLAIEDYIAQEHENA